MKIKRNQHVFEQGDVANTVFYIQKGKVKLTVLSEQGKEAAVGILEPGQFFGEGCLNGHSLRIAITTAMEERVITSITNLFAIGAFFVVRRRLPLVALSKHGDGPRACLFMGEDRKSSAESQNDAIDPDFRSLLFRGRRPCFTPA